MIDTGTLIERGNKFLFRVFGLKPGWHKELDIIKNNHALAKSYMAQGNYKDAVFRLKFLLWIDKGNHAALLDLARAQAGMADKPAAQRTLAQLLALDPQNAEALKLKEEITSGKRTVAAKLEISQELDEKQLASVHKDCFPVYWKEAEVAEMLLTSGTKAWVARAGEPIGMLMTRAQFEQAEILTIAVSPKAQKKSVATQLVLEAERDLASFGVKKIFLEVAENNIAAQALYEKLGYSESSRRKGYYKQADGSAIDALVMSKELR